MKIGFISDVHANLPALEAVFRDMSARNVGPIYCAGDIPAITPTLTRWSTSCGERASIA